MTATPITPSHRLEFDYTVDHSLHKLHMYLETVASGDVTGFDTVARSGHLGVGLHTAIDRVWTKLAPLFQGASTTFGQVLLASHVGSEWIPLMVYTTAIGASSVVSYAPAVENVFVARDSSYERLNFTLLETVGAAPYHASSYGVLAGPFAGIADMLGNAAGTATDADPYSWQKSRGGRYLASWQSVTASLNRRLRRKRGLA